MGIKPVPVVSYLSSSSCIPNGAIGKKIPLGKKNAWVGFLRKNYTIGCLKLGQMI